MCSTEAQTFLFNQNMGVSKESEFYVDFKNINLQYRYLSSKMHLKI
jgi:hypothetical protein